MYSIMYEMKKEKETIKKKKKKKIKLKRDILCSGLRAGKILQIHPQWGRGKYIYIYTHIHTHTI